MVVRLWLPTAPHPSGGDYAPSVTVDWLFEFVISSSVVLFTRMPPSLASVVGDKHLLRCRWKPPCFIMWWLFYLDINSSQSSPRFTVTSDLMASSSHAPWELLWLDLTAMCFFCVWCSPGGAEVSSPFQNRQLPIFCHPPLGFLPGTGPDQTTQGEKRAVCLCVWVCVCAVCNAQTIHLPFTVKMQQQLNNGDNCCQAVGNKPICYKQCMIFFSFSHLTDVKLGYA